MKYGDSTAGNLFGTFRTYDTLKGFQDLNCTRHKPWVVTSEPEHCAFGLISRSGWALFDDSRSPILRNNWVYANTNGKCRVGNKASTPCFGANVNPGGLRYANETACRLAGCCWQGHKNGSTQFVDLVWYTNSVENVLSTSAFPLPSTYKEAQTTFNGPPVGQLLQNSNGRSDLYPMKLWRKTLNDSYMRHYTTTTAEGEKDAVENQFKLLGTLGYLPHTKSHEASQELKLFYCSDSEDHFSSIDNCEACFEKNYTFVRNQGYLYPSANLCTMRTGNEDLYFFGHGVGKTNYRNALKDFSLIAGDIPIPRRHMLGVSWSRWATGGDWNGDQDHQHGAALNISKARFPLDTFVLDMNWHQKPTWTGYTWDQKMYPDHEALLSFLHNDRGLYVGANLHDAQGIMPVENEYKAMANYLKQSDGKTLTFHVSNKSYADGLNKFVLEPLAANGGFDFWWTDWQQGLQGMPGVGTTDVAGLNPTMWLNHYRTMNYTQPNSTRRPQIHSRFGG